MNSCSRTGVGWVGVIPLVVVAIAAISATPVALAQENRVGEMLMELQQIKGVEKVDEGWRETRIAAWLPDEFWAASFEADGVPEAESREIRRLFEGKIILFVLSETLPLNFDVPPPPQRSAQWVRDNTRLIGADGTRHKPIDPAEMDRDLARTLEGGRRQFGASLGKLGQQLQVLVFPGRNEQGTLLSTASREGRLEVVMSGTAFRWNLPLDSLLPPKVCKKCDRPCKGSWRFCPWCGGVPEEVDQ